MKKGKNNNAKSVKIEDEVLTISDNIKDIEGKQQNPNGKEKIESDKILKKEKSASDVKIVENNIYIKVKKNNLNSEKEKERIKNFKKI